MKPAPFGLLAEFESPEELLSAAQLAHGEGFRRVDAFSPFPIEGLSEALGKSGTRVPLLVFTGAAVGAIIGYLLQYYCAALAYPLNVGGRPLNNWPAFIPVTFKMTVLLGALSAVIGMHFLNGLPMPYHPAFNVPRFALASRDRFFLLIESSDRQFDLETTKTFLLSLEPFEISEVPV